MTVPAEILLEADPAVGRTLRRSWRDERDARVIELRKAGKTLEEISLAVGVAKMAASKIIAAAGLPRTLGEHRRRTRPMSPRDEAIVTRYTNGETLQQIGNDLGITRERIRQIIKQWEAKTGQLVPRKNDQFDAVYSCRWCGRLTQYQIHCSRACSSTSIAFAAAERHRDVALKVVDARTAGHTWMSICDAYGISSPSASRIAFYGALLRNFTVDQLSLIWPRYSGKFRAKFERLSSHRKFPNASGAPTPSAILSPNSTLDRAGPAPTGPARSNGGRDGQVRRRSLGCPPAV